LECLPLGELHEKTVVTEYGCETESLHYRERSFICRGEVSEFSRIHHQGGIVQRQH